MIKEPVQGRGYIRRHQPKALLSDEKSGRSSSQFALCITVVYVRRQKQPD